MGTGYTRNDTPNNIADGNVINASDLDGEFDAIQAAFNATTGHSHDGTTGEGPQIGTAGIANDAVTLGTKTSGNYVAAGAVSGVGLSGSASSEGATFTVTSNATSANTASTIVARDASGNFSAGQISGTSFASSGDMTFGDNDKAVFGAGSDLQIYHDGSKSVIQDTGTGNLVLRGSDFQLKGYTVDENMITAINNGAVNIFYDSAVKLSTTSSGIDVTGTVTADGLTVDTNTLHVDATNNRVGIVQSSPDAELHIGDGSGASDNTRLRLTGGTSGQSTIQFGDTASANIGQIQYDHSNNSLAFRVNTGTRAIIDSNGNVGIGTTSVDNKLHLENAGSLYLQIENTTTANKFYLGNSSGNAILQSTGAYSMNFITNGSEAARIDSSGSLMAGKTATNIANDGFEAHANNYVGITRNASIPLFLNRRTDDGGLIQFRKDNTEIGSIGSYGGVYANIGTGNVGLMFNTGGQAIIPHNMTTNAPRGSGIDLGQTGYKWKDAYFSGYAYAGYFAGQSDTNTYVHFPGSDVMQFNTGGSERARVDASGNLLVGKTTNGIANTGNEFAASGYAYHTRSGGITLYCNRLTSDGGIAQFRKAGVSIGEIGVDSGDNLYLTGQTGNTGGIYMNDAAVSPAYQGAERDAYYDLGKGAARWKNLYLSGQANVGTAVAATQSASVTGSTTLDFSTYQNFILTMTGNITLAQPSTEQAGQSGFIIFIHSGAARTVSLGADYETAGAAGLTLSGASGAVDLVPYVVQSSGNILLGAPQLAFA